MIFFFFFSNFIFIEDYYYPNKPRHYVKAQLNKGYKSFISQV